MAYESGVTSGVEDLLDKIRVVALARGWTVNAFNQIDPTYKYLALQHNGEYFNLMSQLGVGGADGYYVPNYLNVWLSTNYGNDVGGGLSNPSPVAQANAIGSNVPYKIFSGANYIHVVVEVATGIFIFIMIGHLNKYGAYTGGAYCTCTHTEYDNSSRSVKIPSQHYIFQRAGGVHVEIDGYYNFYHAPLGGPTSPHTETLLINAQIAIERWAGFSPNDFNLVSAMQPIVLSVHRGSGLYSPIGEVPDIRALNIKNMNSGDVLTIGADNWEVYSMSSESVSQIGYAFKK